MFGDIKLLHEMQQHLQSLSLATPRGIGFADEPINASDYIMSGVSGETLLGNVSHQEGSQPPWRTETKRGVA